MKLTHVSIDHFGRWHDLELPLSGDFSLFYGPNEAGKSTLLRFIRGVLFGFSRDEHESAAGELRVEHAGRTHTVRREADREGRGTLTVSNIGQGEKAERWVRDSLGGIGEDLFETVFAIGLNELQQLSSLDADEVAESIYGLSLGPEGERVLRAGTLLHEGRRRLLDDEERGVISTLLRRRNDLDAEIARLPDEWERSDALSSEREELRNTLSAGDRKREELRRELRGMNFMERVYAPWRKQQQLIEEQNRLGLHDFPADAPDRLLTVEQHLTRLEEQRRSLRADDVRLKRDYDRLVERPELVDNGCRVTMLLEQEQRVRDLKERLRDVDREEKEASRRKESQLQTLGVSSFDAIDPPRLKQPAVSELTRTITRDSQDPVSLLSEADAYRKVGRRYRAHLKRFRSAEAKQKRRSSDLKNKIQGTGARTLPSAIETAEKQLKKLESIRLLGHRERLLDLQLKALKKSNRKSAPAVSQWSNDYRDNVDDGLPQLFGAVMFIYIVGGVACVIGGVTLAVKTAAYLGAAWLMLGFATLGTAMFLREYFMSRAMDGGSGAETRSSKEAIREIETELRKTRQEIDRLDPTGDSGLLYRGRPVESKARVRDDIDSQVEQSKKLVIELRGLATEEDKLRKNRDVLSRMRTSLRGEKQTLHNAKQAWARALRTAGLRETLKISDALEAWNKQQSKRHNEQMNELTSLIDDQRNQQPQVVTVENVDFDGRRRLIQSELDRFDDQVTDLAIRLNESSPGSDPFAWLRRMKEQVDAIERQKVERLRLRRERKDVRTKLEDNERERSRYQSSRSDIYAEAGVTTADAFEARAKAVSRASILATQIDEVRQEVSRIAQSETELAIVEDDLMTFDAVQNKRAIDSTNRELSQLDTEIETARERFGRLEAELDELASERSTARLRFEREQVEGRLNELASDYLAAGVAAEALDGVREQVEQNCQPETLLRAARYLSKLTQGKYTRVWTQLGRRELLVSGSDDQQWTVGELSTGTREQLFLAIRLAMAEEFAEQGGELPLVLDDVLVNFDQHRTEAAIDALMDVAETGQQVLMFSCHLHVASLLEARGMEAVTLPGRDAVRLAG